MLLLTPNPDYIIITSGGTKQATNALAACQRVDLFFHLTGTRTKRACILCIVIAYQIWRFAFYKIGPSSIGWTSTPCGGVVHFRPDSDMGMTCSTLHTKKGATRIWKKGKEQRLCFDAGIQIAPTTGNVNDLCRSAHPTSCLPEDSPCGKSDLTCKEKKMIKSITATLFFLT